MCLRQGLNHPNPAMSKTRPKNSLTNSMCGSVAFIDPTMVGAPIFNQLMNGGIKVMAQMVATTKPTKASQRTNERPKKYPT